ncbi:hypothetical protein D9M71_389900 [compost metagenome]
MLRVVIRRIEVEPQRRPAVGLPMFAQLRQQSGLAEAGGRTDENQTGACHLGQPVEEPAAREMEGGGERCAEFSRIDPNRLLVRRQSRNRAQVPGLGLQIAFLAGSG